MEFAGLAVEGAAGFLDRPTAFPDELLQQGSVGRRSHILTVGQPAGEIDTTTAGRRQWQTNVMPTASPGESWLVHYRAARRGDANVKAPQRTAGYQGWAASLAYKVATDFWYPSGIDKAGTSAAVNRPASLCPWLTIGSAAVARWQP